MTEIVHDNVYMRDRSVVFQRSNVKNSASFLLMFIFMIHMYSLYFQNNLREYKSWRINFLYWFFYPFFTHL